MLRWEAQLMRAVVGPPLLQRSTPQGRNNNITLGATVSKMKKYFRPN